MIKHQVNDLIECLHLMDLDAIQMELDSSVGIFTNALLTNKPILVCGNGGSAADSQHIAGELVGKFLLNRKALNVRALCVDTSVITSWSNDVCYDTVFARQVEAYGCSGAVLWAISTSGTSKNVVLAARKAKELGMNVIALTGANGGALLSLADVCIKAPSCITPRIQEIHIMFYHYLCEQIEAKFRESV